MRDENRYQGQKAPFAYRGSNSDGEFIEDDLRQRYLKFMKVRRDEGMPYREISKRVMTELGVKLSHSEIRKILEGTRKTAY
ncbi:MAG: hypothetical protein IT291_09715 [Deltaproteobacteria bacterium]|nr:hypothetical protein [Deltaproteobacteria bacterium]